jgi:Holliday junction DNA helicase RuvA
MIAQLKGKIISKHPTGIVLDVHGVGFEINITTTTFESLGDADEISLYTYLSVREDSLTLYGFATNAEKEMFKLLIGISGIGPKLAQSILSGIQIEELKSAISQGNISRITVVPGIGRKTAERLLVELRDKVETVEEVTGEAEPLSSVRSDAVAALVSLGYNPKQAEKIVRGILAVEPEISIEDLIRRALSSINK